MTEIVYPVNLRFPMERANSIQIIRTCHALARGGARVTLMVRGGKDPTSEVDSLAFYGLAPHRNLRILRLPVLPRSAPAALRNRGFILTLAAACAAESLIGRADAFYTRDGVARALVAGRALLRAPVIHEMHHVPSLYLEMLHTMYPDAPPVPADRIARQARIDRALYERADAIVCVTGALRDCLAETFGPRPRVYVVRSAVDLPAEPPKRNPARALIMYVGQLYPWKGVDTLVHAMKRLPDATLEIIGGLPYEPDAARLEALAGSLGVIGRVTFRSFVPPGELGAHLARATVVAVPLPDNIYSRRFTSPLKIFEAMGAGVPVVVSDLPAIREVIRDGSNGLLVPPGDPDALAAALRKVIEDPALAEALARQARRDAEAHSWERRAEALRAVIEEVR
jgi:glycosyltransferase involved in cell wall biosynthesis